VRDEFISGLLALTGEEGWTVFLSSHDIDEVERLADRVALIDAGKLQLDCEVSDLLNATRRIEVVCASEPTVSKPFPEWFDFHQSGRSISFVVSDFNGDESALQAQIQQNFGKDARITVAPMSLREVFIALAKKYRIEEGEAV